MIHPFTAHFAVALPLFATLLSLIFLLTRKEYLSRSSTQAITIGAIAMVVALLTGNSAGPDAYPLLSDEGQALLKEHKAFGLYVVIAAVFAAALKNFACIKKNMIAEVLSLLLLVAVSAMVLNQGKMGGELVYNNGAGVANYSDGMDCLDDPSMYVEDEEDEEDEE